jgi:NADPH:quinone reductase-like Zn-dependent oxidoreductase
MFAVVLKEDGYSGQATGPHIENAADWLVEANLPLPKAGAGQVVIRPRMASVNPSDLHFIKGEYGQPRVKGAAAGFEGCGEVVKAGPGAEALLGKRVAFVAANAGAWAEYVKCEALNCIPLREDISDEDGAAQIVNPLTAMAMVDIAVQAKTALVISAASSQLGKLMIGLARDSGLETIALVRRAAAIAPLEALGATRVLDVTQPGFMADFRTARAAIKPRVFLDAVGDQTSEQVFSNMPNGARWVIYGNLGANPPKLTQLGQLIFMDKHIEGFWLTKWMRTTPPADQKRVVSAVQARFADGRWRTDISARIPLRTLISELAAATQITDGKVMVTFPAP